MEAVHLLSPIVLRENSGAPDDAIRASGWATSESASVAAEAPAERVLRRALELGHQRKAAFAFIGVSPPDAVLLYGAPGTGKTFLACVEAAAADFSIRPVDTARLARGNVIASERALPKAFVNARSPCVLFVDVG